MHDLSPAWLAVAVFAGRYVVTAAMYLAVRVLAVGARAFKALSPGLLPPMALLFRRTRVVRPRRE
jgi:hypothetical protein